MKNQFVDSSNHYLIIENNIEVGLIKLVQYKNQSFSHIEYETYPSFRFSGIMKKHLPIYLSKLKEKCIIAIVKQDNIPSIRLLQANNFNKIVSFSDVDNYIFLNPKHKFF